jgi:phosphohistidine phosphatase
MKEVIFIRHAKSDWGNESLKDIDRHLSERGYNDAYFLSEWFAKNNVLPQLVITSPAIRAFNTALIFAREMDLDLKNLKLEKNIYEASAEKILQVIRETDNTPARIMICGHNPGFTNICNELSEDMFFDNVPTCGMVSLSFEVDNWKEITKGMGKLNYYKFPKDFKNQD